MREYQLFTPQSACSCRPSPRGAKSTIRVHPTDNTPEALIDPEECPWHNDEVRFKVYGTRIYQARDQETILI